MGLWKADPHFILNEFYTFPHVCFRFHWILLDECRANELVYCVIWCQQIELLEIMDMSCVWIISFSIAMNLLNCIIFVVLSL